jgi:hypothetical protein
MNKRYSPKKKQSIKVIVNANKFVKDRVNSNQRLIEEFQESRKKVSLKSRVFNLGTNPQLMESILFLVKISICAILLPLIGYIKSQPSELLNFNNLYQFFVNQHSDNISKILSSSALEHPVAISFLTEKFIFNPIGKILIKFSLFKGIVNAIENIKQGKEKIERSIMEVLGRSLFNYETFYAIKYTIDIIKPEKKEMSNVERSKYISKCSATILTLFDLILCGTKSPWCHSLKPIQRITYVFPIFVDLGEVFYKVFEGTRNRGPISDPMEIMSLGFQHYCQDTFKLDYNKVVSIKELEKKLVNLNYQGPVELKVESEARLKLFNLLADPDKLSQIAREDPDFKQVYIKLMTQAQTSQLSLVEPDANYQLFRKRFGLEHLNPLKFNKLKGKYGFKKELQQKAAVLAEKLKDKNYAKEFSKHYRDSFKEQQEMLSKNLKDKRHKLLLPPLARYIPYTDKEFWSKEFFTYWPIDKFLVNKFFLGHNPTGKFIISNLWNIPVIANAAHKDNRIVNMDKQIDNINKNTDQANKIEQKIRLNQHQRDTLRTQALNTGALASFIGLSSSLGTSNNDSDDLKKLYSLLSDKNLTEQQRAEVQSLIEQIELRISNK